MVFKLMEDFTSHHKKDMPKNFKSKNCIEAKTNEDNASILNAHFHSLFNSQVQINPTVLNALTQHNNQQELGITPTPNEIKSAINSMAYKKSLGQSRLTTNIIKNLPPRAFNHCVPLIQKFWQDPNTDYSAWCTTLLRVVYKGKSIPKTPTTVEALLSKKPPPKSLASS